MLNRLWPALKGTFAGSVLVANAVAVFSGMIPFALLKLALAGDGGAKEDVTAVLQRYARWARGV